MSSALLPEKIGPVIYNYLANKIEEAEIMYNNILPLINFENRQCGFRAVKTIMKEGGIIDSDFFGSLWKKIPNNGPNKIPKG